ncbi:MAG TPA: hypothetical protein VGW57_11815 [Chthoniobacterales bacterium]|nr:hypothetical protein [Chthoniobacterales bacterium]
MGPDRSGVRSIAWLDAFVIEDRCREWEKIPHRTISKQPMMIATAMAAPGEAKSATEINVTPREEKTLKLATVKLRSGTIAARAVGTLKHFFERELIMTSRSQHHLAKRVARRKDSLVAWTEFVEIGVAPLGHVARG